MKLIKGLFLAVIVSSVFALTGAKAGYTMTYSNIKIPAMSGVYSDGDYTKDNNKKQTLETYNARDSINWNSTRAVEARTKQVLTPTSVTSWKRAPIGKVINWGNENNKIGSYRINLRAVTKTVGQVRYWGMWKYNI